MIYLGIGLTVFLLPLLGLALLSLAAQDQSPPGLVSGSLVDCPGDPNCVCSCSAQPAHQVAPIPFQGDPAAAMDRMVRVLTGLPRAALVTRNDTYLHVVIRTAIFRFPDDVEVLLDAEGRQFHIRSASRAGKSDLGVNRRRVEAIRQRFQQAE